MKIFAIIIVIIMFLFPIIVGILFWVYLRDEIKDTFRTYKELKSFLPSFKKNKIDVKHILSELKKNKELLKKDNNGIFNN